LEAMAGRRRRPRVLSVCRPFDGAHEPSRRTRGRHGRGHLHRHLLVAGRGHFSLFHGTGLVSFGGWSAPVCLDPACNFSNSPIAKFVTVNNSSRHPLSSHKKRGSPRILGILLRRSPARSQWPLRLINFYISGSGYESAGRVGEGGEFFALTRVSRPARKHSGRATASPNDIEVSQSGEWKQGITATKMKRSKLLQFPGKGQRRRTARFADTAPARRSRWRV
jgi:hypothetical protein